MLRSSGFFFLIALFLPVLSGPVLADESNADSVVTLRSAPEINQTTIRLSDVFTGVPEFVDRPIAAAPTPGKSVTYDVRILARLAARYGLDWQPQSALDRIVITRAATYITPAMIEDSVRAKLADQNIKGKMQLLFDNRSLSIALPADREPVFALNNFTYDQGTRRFRARIAAETGSAPLILPLSGRVAMQRDVPVLARRLEAGAVVGKADLDWMTLPEERLANDVVTDTAQLIGRELRTAKMEGQPLSGRDVLMPRLVARGSLVTMKIETPYMTITAQGRALQDGTEGAVVRITNTQSNRVVEGTVDGPGIVRIHTAQKMALAQ